MGFTWDPGAAAVLFDAMFAGSTRLLNTSKTFAAYINNISYVKQGKRKFTAWFVINRLILCELEEMIGQIV